MEFKKYSSIENTYRQKTINSIIQNGLATGVWIVTEKVHGANFSIKHNGEQIKCAKRTSFIEDGETFYNYQLAITEQVLESVKAIYGECDGKELTVFGELFGGNYPHDEVDNLNISSIQKGIWYCPEIKFYVFDIMVDGAPISQTDMVKLCLDNNLLYAKTLFSGTFEECLAYPNDNQTTLPAIFGLPEIEDNICEGVVIKPDVARWDNRGNRLILKNKNEKFSEKKSKPKTEYKDPINDLAEEHKQFYVELQNYMTENRFNNVVSKIGEVTIKDFGKVMGLFTKDCLQEFVVDFPEFTELDKVVRKTITKKFNGDVSNFIRPILQVL